MGVWHKFDGINDMASKGDKSTDAKKTPKAPKKAKG
jgi:hypothetical protein